MGLFGKLMFWKKEEALPDFGKGLDMGLPGSELGAPSPGLPGEHPGMPKTGEGDLGLPGLGEPPSPPAGHGGMEMPHLEESSPPLQPGFGPKPAPPAAAAPVHHAEAASGKDLEIISLKLDSLKATLEAINERLARLEKMAEGGSESHRF